MKPVRIKNSWPSIGIFDALVSVGKAVAVTHQEPHGQSNLEMYYVGMDAIASGNFIVRQRIKFAISVTVRDGWR